MVYDSVNEQVQFTVDTNSLRIGSHTVYVRMKNSDGAWGIARPIANDMEFATPYNLNVEGNKVITAAEYFLDSDPGLGNGTPITAPADGAFDDGIENLKSASFNLNDLSKGLHTLYLRAKDTNGDWGPVREYTFEVRGPSGGIITASEYYIDVDPGPGNGTLLKVNDGAFDEVTEQMHTYLNTIGVSEGLHEVCVRAHSSGGEWSSNYCENLTVGVTTTCLPLSGVLRDEITRMPLANITVNIDGGAYSTKTDQNGFYNLPCILTGKHVVTVVVPTGYVSYSRTIDIPLNSIWDIKLTRSETVNGTDTDSGYSKDPVNTATGNYTYQSSDIELPGIGIPFTFERAYNSLNPFDGPLGFGWAHNYIIALTVNDDGAVTIRWGDGRTETWNPEIGGGFKPQYGVFDTLIDNKNGTYTLRKKDLTRYNFDTSGRLSSIADKNGNKITLTYTTKGLTQITDTAGRVITINYDSKDHITLITDPIGRTITFAYNSKGDIISASDMNSNPTQYTYDLNHQMLSVIDPRGNTIVSNVYDNQKRVVVSQKDAKLGETKYTYEEVDKKTIILDALGNKTTYTYDGVGRSLTATDALLRTTTYANDNNGNRTSLTYPDGKVVNYVYDELNRLETVTDWLGRITTYAYDDTDKLTGILNPNSTSVAIAYDNADRLTGLSNKKSDSTVISSYSYTLDAIGNNGNVIANEPLIPLIPSANVGYTYDAENRMTDAGGIANFFDANGNMMAKGSDTFAYDYNNRLTQSIVSGVITEYGYDGLGNRRVKNENGLVTRYVLDINGSLSNVIAETDVNGTITAYYVYGLGLISKVLPDGTAYYYHYDSRGSTIALTDAGENITDAYTYDPLGNVVNRFGETDNPFRYVGRYGVQDEGNGLQYIRARYYIPELGRFITKDPLTGKDGDSQSLNRYVYVMNNPVVLVDVSGLISINPLTAFVSAVLETPSIVANYTQQIVYTYEQVKAYYEGDYAYSHEVGKLAQESNEKVFNSFVSIVIGGIDPVKGSTTATKVIGKTGALKLIDMRTRQGIAIKIAWAIEENKIINKIIEGIKELFTIHPAKAQEVYKK